MKRRMRRMVRKMIREYRLMCDPYYYPEWLRELEIVAFGLVLGVILVVVLMRANGYWV